MTKRICFLGLGNIFEMPYLKNYTDLIDCEIDLVYWDRRHILEDAKVRRKYAVRIGFKNANHPFLKIIGYVKFCYIATKILKRNNYDGVVLLTGNTAVLLHKILLSKYKGRYIIDIRDYFKEHIVWYYNIQRELIHSSFKTFISSPAFREFLPVYNYVVVHNYQEISIEQIKWFRDRKIESRFIVISNIGTMRFLDASKEVLDVFCNDSRFFLKFIGSGSLRLRDYCDKLEMTNVYLKDRFQSSETLELYKDCHMVLNVYGSKDPLVKYLLSNKLYYAAQLGMPIIVSKGSYMEELIKEYEIGYSFDITNKSFLNDLESYFNNLNRELFLKNCDTFISRVKSDNIEFNLTIDKFLNETERVVNE